MAFTVEDGTGLADATAYLALADFKAHHDDRGGDYSSFDDTALQQAIVRATDYVDKRFGRRFRGDKGSTSQALEWPRSDAYDDEDYQIVGIPAALKKAIAEYALLSAQLGRDLAPVPQLGFSIVNPATGEVTTGGGGGAISEKSEEVGPIKDSTKWDTKGGNGPMVGTGNLVQQIPSYPQADMWIEELIDGYINREVARG